MPSLFDSTKGQKSLRRGRQSVSGATYFLTMCTEHRKRGLENSLVAAALLEHAQNIKDHWRLSAAVVMPDHVHLLVELYTLCELSDAVRLFKGRSASVLRQQGMKWQRGYFDHRLRADEDLLPVFLYIFLNPYRAELIPVGQRWGGYYCSPDDWLWFEPLTASSLPFPEWLVLSRRKAAPTIENSSTHNSHPHECSLPAR